MDVVVRGRHCAVTDRFRRHTETKLSKIERFTQRVIRIDVEVQKEHNPRLADRSERVELTVISRGPVVRAEAAAADRFAALDLALDKLQARLRKAADRRRVHHGSRRPRSVAEATTPSDGTPPLLAHQMPSEPGASVALNETTASPNAQEETPTGPATYTGSRVATSNGAAHDRSWSDDAWSPAAADEQSGSAEDGSHLIDVECEGDGPLIVREKVHKALPMTIDQALYEMELVGHDFYLYIDAESKWPSVVYRRRGYDYGVIRLAD